VTVPSAITEAINAVEPIALINQGDNAKPHPRENRGQFHQFAALARSHVRSVYGETGIAHLCSTGWHTVPLGRSNEKLLRPTIALCKRFGLPISRAKPLGATALWSNLVASQIAITPGPEQSEVVRHDEASRRAGVRLHGPAFYRVRQVDAGEQWGRLYMPSPSTSADSIVRAVVRQIVAVIEEPDLFALLKRGLLRVEAVFTRAEKRQAVVRRLSREYPQIFDLHAVHTLVVADPFAQRRTLS